MGQKTVTVISVVISQSDYATDLATGMSYFLNVHKHINICLKVRKNIFV